MGVFLFSTFFSGFNAAAQGNWELQGNSIGTTDFIGSTNDEDLNFKTNDQKRLIIKKDGTVGIGTIEPKGAFEILYCGLGAEGGSIITNVCLPQFTFLIDPNNMPFVIGQGSIDPPVVENPNIALPSINYKTTRFSPPGQPPFNSKPSFWVRKQEPQMWTMNNTPNQFETQFIVMPDGSVGINTARPRAALDVSGSNQINYPAAIISSLAQGTYGPESQFGGQGMYHTQSVQFVPRLSNNGFNLISQTDDQGMFFTDGKGEKGANENSAFIIAPWAEETDADDIGGLRMDKFGNVELRGDLRATRAKVDAKWWSDFVFDDDYKLPSLAEVEAFIKANKHLPNVPSEAEVLENGIDVANMQAIQQQKIEELTLYIIQLQKQMDAMQQVLTQLNGK